MAPMHSDLERVITLQRLDSAAHDAQRRLADERARAKALDARLEAARQRLASAKDRLAENQNARRAIEKEVAVHQGRLSKFREQAMAVKTNQEYHAVQKEIGFAQGEIKTIEDKILELMVEADDLTATVKRAEADLASEQKAVDADRFLFGCEISLGALDGGRQIVGLDHQLEDLVLDRLDLALREADFLLDGVVFLIGFDRHRLLA